LNATLTSLICIISLAPLCIPHTKADKADALFVVIVNDKRGYIDGNGRIVIQPQFDGASSFSEGLAAVATRANGYAEGYIDTTGAVVIKPQFDTATPFSEGLALVGFDQTKKEVRVGNSTYISGSSHPSYKWGYIDRKGSYVVTPVYPHALGSLNDWPLSKSWRASGGILMKQVVWQSNLNSNGLQVFPTDWRV